MRTKQSKDPNYWDNIAKEKLIDVTVPQISRLKYGNIHIK